MGVPQISPPILFKTVNRKELRKNPNLFVFYTETRRWEE